MNADNWWAQDLNLDQRIISYSLMLQAYENKQNVSIIVCVCPLYSSGVFFLFAALLHVLLLSHFFIFGQRALHIEIAMFRVPTVAEIKKLRGAFSVPVRSPLDPNLCKFQPSASGAPAAL
jgi:hypothetical protein